MLILTSNHTACSHESITFQASNDVPKTKLKDLIHQLIQHSHKAFVFSWSLPKPLYQAFRDTSVFYICTPGIHLICPILTLPEISRPDPPWSGVEFARTAWHGEVSSAGLLRAQPRGSRGRSTGSRVARCRPGMAAPGEELHRFVQLTWQRLPELLGRPEETLWAS